MSTLLEKIPGFSHNNSPQEKHHPTTDLAAITCSPSRYLYLAECLLYGAMAVSASVALFPFFLVAFYWPLAWLLFMFSLVCVINESRKTRNANVLTLDISNNTWRVRRNGVDKTVIPFDDVLLWSWVIILPVKEPATGNKHRIVLLPDSMTADEWRRLRVWLRVCLSQ
ncbi:MAG: hypothetical protein EOO68_01070 [Moraxellaceae bacterium]|nr:MAG: hypothetical protein EOO68_01070 [Moraxellaceae bacterium]